MAHYDRYQAPVRFVEKVLVSNELNVRTVVHLPFSPTRSMLAEAGAQTSVFARLTEQKLAAGIPIHAAGMLLSIKAQWHQKTDKVMIWQNHEIYWLEAEGNGALFWVIWFNYG